MDRTNHDLFPGLADQSVNAATQNFNLDSESRFGESVEPSSANEQIVQGEQLLDDAERMLADEQNRDLSSENPRDANDIVGPHGELELLKEVSQSIAKHVRESSSESEHQEPVQVEAESNLDSESELPLNQEPTPFAVDPYVAQSEIMDPSSSSSPPKTVEQILESISGYRPESNLEPQSSAPDAVNTEQEAGFAPKSEWVEPEDQASNDQTGSQDELAVDPILDEDSQPEFDVRSFQTREEIPTDGPEPIRGGFEFAPDAFDYPVEESSQEQRPLAEVDGASQDNSDGKIRESETNKTQPPSTTNNCFWADCGDVIRVNGDDGFSYIDLACFDKKDAQFRENQIRISCDDGLSFLIEHENIPYALFNHGEKVHFGG